MTYTSSFFSSLRWGLLFGAGAWSAYGLVEFLFTSVVYRLTRPYAEFTPWHWRLTAMVIAGHLLWGLLAGALAGLAVWRWSRDTGRPLLAAMESATALMLAAALIVNMFTGPGAVTGGGVQITGAVLFMVLLALELRSRRWRQRLGWLTSPWIVSFCWLGTALTFSLLRMRLGAQLGNRMDFAAAGVVAAMLAAAAIGLLAGQPARRSGDERRWPLRLNVASCGAAVLLIGVSLALSAGAYSASASADAGSVGPGARPNLVVIVMDTVRADHLSVQGYSRDTTPHLKELAQDSVVYRNAYSASDITLTSHASIFTGMYPSWHRAYSQPPEAVYGREISAEYPTLAELLRKSGYQTVGVAANLYLRADFGLERGFDSFRIPRPVPLLPEEDRSVLRYPLRKALSLVTDTSQFDRLYTFSEDINRELFTALDGRRAGAPFCAFVNYMDAHYPYVPPAPYNGRFAGRRARMTQDDLDADISLISKGKTPSAAYRPHCESQYDGGIAYEDARIGGIVDWLKRHQAYDNTMIVVTSDHGEAFGEKNRTGHANSPYENLLHVALLIKYPANARRGVEEAPVSLIDVAPTALTAMGVAAPASMQGVALNNGAPSPRRIFAETFRNPVAHSPDCPHGCVTKVLWEWPMKLIENRTNRKLEFFDITADPREEHNLVATRREAADAMAAHLQEWTRTLPAQSHEVKKLNPAIENTLRGNGYVGK